MVNMHPALRFVLLVVVFIAVWMVVDWLAVTLVFHEEFEFSIGKHVVAPAVAGAVFCALDLLRERGNSGKN